MGKDVAAALLEVFGDDILEYSWRACEHLHHGNHSAVECRLVVKATASSTLRAVVRARVAMCTNKGLCLIIPLVLHVVPHTLPH